MKFQVSCFLENKSFLLVSTQTHKKYENLRGLKYSQFNRI